MAHHATRRAQRMNRLKQRHWHQARISGALARTSQTHAASLRQPDYIQYIIFGLRAADDVLPDRLRGISSLELMDGAECIDQLAGLWRNGIEKVGRRKTGNQGWRCIL